MPFWWTGTLFSILNLLEGGSILEFWRQTHFSYNLAMRPTSPATMPKLPPTSMYRTFLLGRLVVGEAPGRTFILLTSSRIPRDLATCNTCKFRSLPPPRTQKAKPRAQTKRRSYLDVADLQGQWSHLGAHDVVLGRLAHSAL